jgi:hypothetical protein
MSFLRVLESVATR